MRKVAIVQMCGLLNKNYITKQLDNHCHHNQTEIIWVQLKLYVAEKSITLKTSDILMPIHEAEDNMQTSAWVDCIQHAEELQKYDFER
jgi:hypothetical protein